MPYAMFSACPPAFEVQSLPHGSAQVTFYYDTHQLFTSDDEEGERWRCQFYSLVTMNSANLAHRVGSDYAGWFAAAKEQEDARVAAAARLRRNTALAESDYLLLPDYPIDDDTRALVIEYRQVLRDLPETPGWPHEVVWPERPALSSGILRGP